MSTSYGYRCLDCKQNDLYEDEDQNPSPLWMQNSMMDILKDFPRALPHYEALTSVAKGWIEVTILGVNEYPGPFTWLGTHKGHRLVIHDEYGRDGEEVVWGEQT